MGIDRTTVGARRVELVLLTPALLIVVLTIVAFGRVSESRQQVAEAASAGAEAGATCCLEPALCGCRSVAGICDGGQLSLRSPASVVRTPPHRDGHQSLLPRWVRNRNGNLRHRAFGPGLSPVCRGPPAFRRLRPRRSIPTERLDEACLVLQGPGLYGWPMRAEPEGHDAARVRGTHQGRSSIKAR